MAKRKGLLATMGLVLVELERMAGRTLWSEWRMSWPLMPEDARRAVARAMLENTLRDFQPGRGVVPTEPWPRR